MFRHPRRRLHIPVGYGADRPSYRRTQPWAHRRTGPHDLVQHAESAGSSLERVVRVHVVLADISQMADMDRVYREFFPVDPPARTAWSMQLRFGNGCEIECVALAG